MVAVFLGYAGANLVAMGRQPVPGRAPRMGVGLTEASAVKRWNKEARDRASELRVGEADPPRCMNVHPPRPWQVRT